MRIKNISLEELEMPYGCKLEIQEIFDRKGIPGPITLPIMSANSKYLKKTAAGSTLDALVKALEREGINPAVVKYFVKEDARRKAEPPTICAEGQEIALEEDTPSIEAPTATTERGVEAEGIVLSIERIDQQIELLQKLKANMEEGKKIIEQLVRF